MRPSETGRTIQVIIAGAVLLAALVLTQVRALGATCLATALSQSRAAETYEQRLDQAEMLMETGCLEPGSL